MIVITTDDIPEVAEMLARRKTLGIDGHDEVWEGTYHMTPYAHSRHGRLETRLAFTLQTHIWSEVEVTGPFNLGDKDDFRVPDLAIRELSSTDDVYVPTALIVVEILSPDDESYAKIPFYFAHGVSEILIADPESKTVRCFTQAGETGFSALLDVSVETLEFEINWP